jgi:hypothetical protein
MPEACQRLPRRSEIHYVAIRRLRQKDAGHNWKAAYIVPQPSLLISGEPLLYRRLHLNGASGVGGLNPRGRPPAINPRRGITLAGLLSAGSAGEQSERSVAWRGLVSILNGQN